MKGGWGGCQIDLPPPHLEIAALKKPSVIRVNYSYLVWIFIFECVLKKRLSNVVLT